MDAIKASLDDKPNSTARDDGDVTAAVEGTEITAEYTVPWLAHTTMEPMKRNRPAQRRPSHRLVREPSADHRARQMRRGHGAHARRRHRAHHPHGRRLWAALGIRLFGSGRAARRSHARRANQNDMDPRRGHDPRFLPPRRRRAFPWCRQRRGPLSCLTGPSLRPP